MRRIFAIALTAALILCLASCASGTAPQETAPDEPEPPVQTQPEETVETMPEETVETAPEQPEETGEEQDSMIYAHIGDSVLTIKPEDNSSAKAFLDLLAGGDVTVEMHDYGGFEKVGSLGTSLTRNDEQITTEPGDVILYQGNQITIYYGVNSWSFTRLGRVQDMSQSELIDALGDDPTVVFSLF